MGSYYVIFGEAKVNQVNNGSLVGDSENEVIWLDVTVNETEAM